MSEASAHLQFKNQIAWEASYLAILIATAEYSQMETLCLQIQNLQKVINKTLVY